MVQSFLLLMLLEVIALRACQSCLHLRLFRALLWPIHNHTQRRIYHVETDPSWTFWHISQCSICTGITAAAAASSLLDFVCCHCCQPQAPPSKSPESVDLVSQQTIGSKHLSTLQQTGHTRPPGLATAIWCIEYARDYSVHLRSARNEACNLMVMTEAYLFIATNLTENSEHRRSYKESGTTTLLVPRSCDTTLSCKAPFTR